MSSALTPDSLTPSSEIQQKAEDEHQASTLSLAIYIASHCPNCAYAYEVAELVQRDFPQVQLRIVDLESTTEPIPETVFATPTYLLNGRVWSLGNPSLQQVTTTLQQLLQP